MLLYLKEMAEDTSSLLNQIEEIAKQIDTDELRNCFTSLNENSNYLGEFFVIDVFHLAKTKNDKEALEEIDKLLVKYRLKYYYSKNYYKLPIYISNLDSDLENDLKAVPNDIENIIETIKEIIGD